MGVFNAQGKPVYRPFDDIEPEELARYQKAKRITDTKKLAAMLPACVKSQLFKPLLPIIYDTKQRLPRIESGADWKYNNDRDHSLKFRKTIPVEYQTKYVPDYDPPAVW